MSQHLPLVAAQPGIWMAEKLSELPSAWSVAHYVELTGEVDSPLLARAVVAGLAQADTLRMRFTEDNGEVWQWVDDALTFELPEIIDLRTNIDPHGTAQALMQADLQQDLRVDSGKPLVFHQLIQVADNRWYWYQRYHHLLVDGFSFPAITRQIANIYCTWLRGEPTPASPFTPFADVVEEYQQYRESEAWQRDAAFWAEQRRQLPPPASLSPAPLPGRSASADILRLKLEFTDGEFRQLATQLSGVQRTDLALALAALWLGRLCNRMDYAAGFIFMRRLGSAALTATGPVLNVLPLGIHIAAQETLPELATRLAAQLKKMRRHQRYDAEQIVRDSGRAAGDEPLFGPVLNIKVFDYQLDIPGVQAQTHTLATGPVNDLELALFPDEHGDLSIEILANKQRYDEPTLIQHAERLKMLIAQFAADPALLCGDVDIMLPGEYAQLAQLNATQVEIPETTLSALVAEQAAKTPDAPALADARYDDNIGVIILTGAGDKAFCSGGDQKVRGDYGGYKDDSGVHHLNVLDFQRQIRTCPKPVVAMVAGYSIGGGHVLHMMCDLTIAADNAIFGQTGPKVGSFDGGWGASYMARIVGQKKAREIWFLCRQYDAKQALDMGLVNTVVPLADLEKETVRWCREMLQNSPMALRCLKAALNADCDGQAGLQELAGNATMLFYMTEEGQEGRNAFNQKRQPDFSKFKRNP